MNILSKSLTAVLLGSFATAAMSAETMTYTYDSKGRLLQVIKSGGPNNGSTTTYNYDKADNRTRVVTSGSPR